MSVPHRIGAAFCVISEPKDPKEKLDPKHKISPASKEYSDEGLANEGDLTPAREGYGGGSNSYFTKYPDWLVTKAKGTLYDKDDEDFFPVIKIELVPYRNRRESKVIDNRSVPESYDSSYQNLPDVTDGKGEFITVVDENLWEESKNDPTSPLYGIEYPTYLPGVEEELEDGQVIEQFKEEILWPETRFYPWGVNSLQPFDNTKADYLCSLRIPNCDVSPLWVRREPPDLVEDPPDSGNYFPRYTYEPWQPSITEEGEAYASYYNTSTWKLRVKADECCWNKGYKIKGRIKIAKRMLKFDPAYTDPTSGLPVRFGGKSTRDFYAYFEGHRFVLDDNFAPDEDYKTIDWEIEIKEDTATGEWVDAEEIDIPSEPSGEAFEVTYICGFYVDDATPPEPPV